MVYSVISADCEYYNIYDRLVDIDERTSISYLPYTEFIRLSERVVLIFKTLANTMIQNTNKNGLLKHGDIVLVRYRNSAIDRN